SFEKSQDLDTFLRRAVEARLRMLVPVKNQWSQAMALMALPQNAPTALGLLAELVDEIWAHAGDKSTDVSPRVN
ncbi:Ubiquinone biosynthesis protein coq9, mitochondrial, partial [Cichlidogyrus casuarinus]